MKTSRPIFRKGKEAREGFERTMIALFRAPKTVSVSQNPAPQKKESGK